MLKKKKFKLYKRENINLFLKNTLISNKFLSKFSKNYKQNFKNNFIITTHYSDQLKEKRKLKIIYGISDKKYNIYYNNSKNMKGNIFKNILNFLECRLDNFVYRMGLSVTRSEAKQIISHGFIKVNNKILNYSSKILKIGDCVSFNLNKNFFRRDYFELYFNNNSIPQWIFVNKNKFFAYLKRFPSIEELKIYINIKDSLIFGNCT